jgi:hypothetical protein
VLVYLAWFTPEENNFYTCALHHNRAVTGVTAFMVADLYIEGG